jgi:hypothetical protein
MAKRLYIVPKIGTGAGDDAYRPKYFKDLDGVSWSAMDYGLEPHFLVASELTTDQHNTLVANADVIAVPANLDAQVGTNRDAVVDALETLNVPAGWVTTTMTYRKILKIVAAIMLFAQRLHGHGGIRIFESGITLSTKFNKLPAATRTKLIAAAQSMNFDTSSLAGTSTIRQILKAMADQWSVKDIKIGGLVL